PSAVREASDVTSAPNCDQSTREAIATSGSTTNAAPTAAGTKIQPGRPGPCRGRDTLWPAEPGVREHLLTGLAEHEVDELAGELGVIASGERSDRVGVDDGVRLREVNALDLVARGDHVGDVDEPRVGLSG